MTNNFGQGFWITLFAISSNVTGVPKGGYSLSLYKKRCMITDYNLVGYFERVEFNLQLINVVLNLWN